LHGRRELNSDRFPLMLTDAIESTPNHRGDNTLGDGAVGDAVALAGGLLTRCSLPEDADTEEELDRVATDVVATATGAALAASGLEPATHFTSSILRGSLPVVVSVAAAVL